MIKMANNLYEFRKFVFKGLMKMGYKFIAKDKNGELYAYSDEPTKQSWGWGFYKKTNMGKLRNISLLNPIFADINWEDVEPFRIPYVDIDNFDE